MWRTTLIRAERLTDARDVLPCGCHVSGPHSLKWLHSITDIRILSPDHVSQSKRLYPDEHWKLPPPGAAWLKLRLSCAGESRTSSLMVPSAV
jgi:hypothetical protein